MVIRNIDELLMRLRQEAATRPDPYPHPLEGPLYSGKAAHVPVPDPKKLVVISNQDRETLWACSDREFLDYAYLQLLGRRPDDSGLHLYLSALARGRARCEIAAAIAFSPEASSERVLPGMGRPMRLFGWLRKRRIFPLVFLGSWLCRHFEALRRRIARRRLAEREVLLATMRQLQTELDSQRSQLTQIALAQTELEFLKQHLKEWADRSEADKREISCQQEIVDRYYLAFEDACRGPRDQIRQGLEIYLPFVHEALSVCPGGEVLDLGCGRGEWLELLQWYHLPCRGIDLNPNMVAFCESIGLLVSRQDVLDTLMAQPDSSLAVVSSFHLIEHLPFTVLYQVVREIVRVLQPGGLLLLETPNPENILVGSHTFYHDFSHRNPITPTSLTFLAKYHGLVDIQVIRRNPYPDSAKVAGDDPLTDRVNGHFCGPQDFAVTARKPPCAS